MFHVSVSGAFAKRPLSALVVVVIYDPVHVNTFDAAAPDFPVKPGILKLDNISGKKLLFMKLYEIASTIQEGRESTFENSWSGNRLSVFNALGA